MTNYIQLFAINAQDISGTVTQGNAVMYNTLTTSTPTNNIRTGIRDKDFGSSVLMNSVLRQNSFAAYLLGEMFIEPNFITTAGTDFNTDTPSNATTDANNFSSFLLKIRNVVNSNSNQHAHTSTLANNYITSSGQYRNTDSQFTNAVNKYIYSSSNTPTPVKVAKYCIGNADSSYILRKQETQLNLLSALNSNISNRNVRCATRTFAYDEIQGFYHRESSGSSGSIKLRENSTLSITCVTTGTFTVLTVRFYYIIGSGQLWGNTNIINGSANNEIQLCKLPNFVPQPTVKTDPEFTGGTATAGIVLNGTAALENVRYFIHNGYVYVTMPSSGTNYRRFLSNDPINTEGIKWFNTPAIFIY